MSFPAHCPYEMLWTFCPICQRFYFDITSCPIHSIKLRIEKVGKKKQLHKIALNGLGLPVWTSLPEANRESIERFRQVQKRLEPKIKSAPIGKETTFAELGSSKFKQHWFIRHA
jgi:hypothetical protein